MEAKQVAFIRCTEANQRFFDAVIEFQRMAGSAYPLPRFPDRSPAALARRGIPMPTTAARHFSKAKSTLHQLVREWGVEGQAERDSCYGVLLEQLKRWLPVTEHTMYVTTSAACGVSVITDPMPPTTYEQQQATRPLSRIWSWAVAFGGCCCRYGRQRAALITKQTRLL